MPAVPNQPHAAAGAGAAAAATAASGGGGAPMPAVQPAPAVVQVESHVKGHVLPRRFLGPVPQAIARDADLVAQRRHMKKLRRSAMDKLLGEEESDALRERARRHAAARTFRVQRKDWTRKVRDKDEEIQVESSSSSSDEDTKEARKISKGTPIQNWVGESFDIGREFESINTQGNPDPAVVGEDRPEAQTDTMKKVESHVLDNVPTTEEPEETLDEPPPDPDPPGKGKQVKKPSSILTGPSTTAQSFKTAKTRGRPLTARDDSVSGATFVTAKTDLDSSDSDTSSDFTARIPKSNPLPPPSASVHSSPRVIGSSRASSTRPLYGGSSDEDDEELPDITLTRADSQKNRRSSTGETARPIPRRLKSALRGNQSDSEVHAPPHLRVQFPDNPVTGGVDLGTGDQEPADPQEVLARTGAETAGTSAHDTIGDYDEFLPGGIVMRDRMLVKVGRHRDEGLRSFDEMSELRNPCYRFDPLEEYVGVMTPTSVEFFTDWSWRLQEYYRGTKQLRFAVPLSPVTSLTIFDQTDMSLSLVCPWPSIVRQTARSKDKNLRKMTSTWDRARHSSLADRLGMDRHGAAVFILNFSERSRALDWLWYISEQLGNRLPAQMDIAVPAVEQTLRTVLPDHPSSMNFNVQTALESIWKAILADEEQMRLLRELHDIPQLQLAWKGTDATLDWVAYETTVTGKPRDWALLASFAQCATVRGHRVLQARNALHAAVRVRLEDGTTLDEPAGVEGYLVRHKVGGMPKETIYLSINDGHMFVSPMIGAMPPLRPGKAGSSPATLFPELHKRFLKSEHRRMSTFVEKCDGCFSLSEIAHVELVKPSEPSTEEVPDAVNVPSGSALAQAMPPSPAQAMPPSPSTPRATTFAAGTNATPKARRRTRGMSIASHTSVSSLKVVKKTGKQKEREFKVVLRSGQTVKFEAHAPEIAAEWVERLGELVKYWTLRPRVDARGQMDTVQVHTRAGAFMGKILDLEVERTLNNIWNWCVIDGCRAITHSSPIYVREGPWAKFRAMYCVLTGGSLVLFRVKGSVSLQTRRRVYPLFGAYVFSGRLALEQLDANNNETLFNPKARIYSDGLQTTDGVEDTTFCIKLTWPTGRLAPAQPWDQDDDSDDNGVDIKHTDKKNQDRDGKDDDKKDKDKGKKGSKQKSFTAPRLNGNPLMLFFRARSQLERDKWVWAINCEMERFARSHVREGQILRDYGSLPQHSTVSRA